MAKIELVEGASILNTQDELDFLTLITAVDKPIKFGKVGEKKGNPYWRVEYLGAVWIVESKEDAQLIKSGKAGKASIVVTKLDEATEAGTTHGLEIKKLISDDVMDTRKQRTFKHSLLTIENYTANPEAVAKLAGLTVTKVQALADA